MIPGPLHLFTLPALIDPVAIWVQAPEARWLLKPLPIPIVYWISIIFMAISTKIKAKILSSKSSWAYEHLSCKCSVHVKCWGQEPFFSRTKVCKAPSQANRFSSQKVLCGAAKESSLGLPSESFLFLSHFWQQGKIVLSDLLEARKSWAKVTCQFWTLAFHMI